MTTRNDKPLTIGPVRLDHPFILAPMAGVTDLPFRLLCREQGAGMVCSEMVSAKALYYGLNGKIPRTPGELMDILTKRNAATARLLTTVPGERPLSVQIFGSEPALMAAMGAVLEQLPFDVLDVNMGCPVPKVVNNHEGSALMADPRLAQDILRSLVKAVKKPVTVKLRLGVDRDHINVLEIARRAQEAGVAAVAVHGRTRDQMYSGTADWDMIGKVAEALDIPVIGNGDVFTAQDGINMMKQTGCAGVMVARGARGNPWIFRELAALYDTGVRLERPDGEQIRNMILRHLSLKCEYMQEAHAVREMRRHVAWYTAGIPHSARLRSMINQAAAAEDVERLVDSLTF